MRARHVGVVFEDAHRLLAGGDGVGVVVSLPLEVPQVALEATTKRGLTPVTVAKVPVSKARRSEKDTTLTAAAWVCLTISR